MPRLPSHNDWAPRLGSLGLDVTMPPTKLGQKTGQLEVSNNKVTLRGAVRALSERSAVEEAA
jgi:hypothetical protein